MRRLLDVTCLGVLIGLGSVAGTFNCGGTVSSSTPGSADARADAPASALKCTGDGHPENFDVLSTVEFAQTPFPNYPK
jgi:hypothetical protein